MYQKSNIPKLGQTEINRSCSLQTSFYQTQASLFFAGVVDMVTVINGTFFSKDRVHFSVVISVTDAVHVYTCKCHSEWRNLPQILMMKYRHAGQKTNHANLETQRQTQGCHTLMIVKKIDVKNCSSGLKINETPCSNGVFWVFCFSGSYSKWVFVMLLLCCWKRKSDNANNDVEDNRRRQKELL